jgi:uncharacterized protein (TIGR02266 family)
VAERRRSVRAVARIEVYEAKDTRHTRVPLYISGNVSAGGIFLITQEPFKTGTNLKISFSLPGDPRVIDTFGSVIWSRGLREASDRQPGMGVQFSEIKKEDRDRIRDFVNEQIEAGNEAVDD